VEQVCAKNLRFETSVENSDLKGKPRKCPGGSRLNGLCSIKGGMRKRSKAMTKNEFIIEGAETSFRKETSGC